LTPPRHALFAALLAGGALLPVPTLAQPHPAPATEAVKIDVRQFTLPNGLTAIVYTDHAVPSVYLGMRYRTGSRDEPAGRTGFAHLFEHLMFQSTRNRKGGFLPAMEAIGASDINGQTIMRCGWKRTGCAAWQTG
jgi:zinc protease